MNLDTLKEMNVFELSFAECVDEIRDYFNEDYGKIEFDGTTLRLITGGWSDNEDVISALQDNTGFWTKYWRETHRGGLFIFTEEKTPIVSSIDTERK